MFEGGGEGRMSREDSTQLITGILTLRITRSSCSFLTFSNACLPFSASPQIPRESRVRRDRIPRRIASWSLTIRIHVRRHSRLPRPTTVREPLDPWPQPGQTRFPSLRRTGYGSHYLQQRSSL